MWFLTHVLTRIHSWIKIETSLPRKHSCKNRDEYWMKKRDSREERVYALRCMRHWHIAWCLTLSLCYCYFSPSHETGTAITAQRLCQRPRTAAICSLHKLSEFNQWNETYWLLLSVSIKTFSRINSKRKCKMVSSNGFYAQFDAN